MFHYIADTSADAFDAVRAAQPPPTKVLPSTGAPTVPPTHALIDIGAQLKRHLIRTDAVVAAGVEAGLPFQVLRLQNIAKLRARTQQPEAPESVAATAAADTIAQVLSELTAGRRARAIDVVYDALDSLLLAARFDDARVMVIAFAQNRLPLAVLLSALTITFPWRSSLGEARTLLSSKAQQVARADGGEAKVQEIARFL